MQLQNGRPTDTTGRLDKEIRTYDFLDKLGIEYQRIDHEAAFTMEFVRRLTRHSAQQSARIFFCATARKPIFTC